MKTITGLLFAFLFTFTGFRAMCQDTSARYQVAIFTPLYLDSAFDETSSYKFGKAFPKFFNPGLEFYEGAELALDSLNSEGVNIDVFVYDSRSTTRSIESIVKSPEFDSIDLVIGHVN